MYICEIVQTITKFNEETQDWSGEFFDCGVIEKFKAKTKIELLKKVDSVYSLASLDSYEIDGELRLETNFTDENNDVVDLVFYFIKVTEEPADMKKEIEFIKQWNK